MLRGEPPRAHISTNTHAHKHAHTYICTLSLLPCPLCSLSHPVLSISVYVYVHIFISKAYVHTYIADVDVHHFSSPPLTSSPLSFPPQTTHLPLCYLTFLFFSLYPCPSLRSLSYLSQPLTHTVPRLRQRRKAVNAIDVMRIIKELEDNSADQYSSLSSHYTEDQLRERLPLSIKNRSWGEISKVRILYTQPLGCSEPSLEFLPHTLGSFEPKQSVHKLPPFASPLQVVYDLRRVLQDINCADVQAAHGNIMRVSALVEHELLSQFEICLASILLDPDDTPALITAKGLVSSLCYFNGGKSAQDLFLFEVKQNRIKSHHITDPALVAVTQQTFTDFVASNTVITREQ